MKRIARLICLFLALTLLLAAPARAAQREEASTFSSYYFASWDPSIYLEPNQEIEIWFDVVGVDTMQEIGVSRIEMQRSVNMRDWITVRVYEPDDYPQMICENTGFHGGYVTYTGIPGYYYRAYVVFYARRSANSWGEMPEYSNIVLVE